MTDFIKRFSKWILVKSDLDRHQHAPPWFNEGEIWWCSIGENVGVEISGKGVAFRRPILVLKKLDRFSFIGIPLSTTLRTGNWYVRVRVNGIDNIAIIAQIRHIDYRRLDKRIYVLSTDDLRRIRETLSDLLLLPIPENKSPALTGRVDVAMPNNRISIADAPQTSSASATTET